MGEYTGIDNGFMDLKPKAQATKAKIVMRNYTKLKNFYTPKDQQSEKAAYRRETIYLVRD